VSQREVKKKERKKERDTSRYLKPRSLNKLGLIEEGLEGIDVESKRRGWID
jgi:hypothetical protein